MLYFGAFAVSILSAIAGIVWSRLQSKTLAILAAIAFPVGATWLAYWLPLYNVTDKSEYQAWFGAFAMMWLVFALPVSLAVTILIWNKRRHHSVRNG